MGGERGRAGLNDIAVFGGGGEPGGELRLVRLGIKGDQVVTGNQAASGGELQCHEV